VGWVERGVKHGKDQKSRQAKQQIGGGGSWEKGGELNLRDNKKRRVEERKKKDDIKFWGG